MLSQKSLRTKFSIQLASASAMLILIFSVMLYHYIKITIFENVVQNLTSQAQNIVSRKYNAQDLLIYYPDPPQGPFWVRLDRNRFYGAPKFIKSTEGARHFLTLHYPYTNNDSLSLRQETTIYASLVNQILLDIIIINATMIFLIIFYALFLSRMLLMPIKTISNRLSKLNEKFLRPIDETQIPQEFEPLCDSINRLIERIQTFALYQKELFVGVAHELKTPLAVMKTKNEVTLIKERDSQKYIEALKRNNISIDNMNKMISSILEIGRQEGAQFEEAEEKEMISYLEELIKNFKILARGEEKDINANLNPNKLFLMIQSSLFMHVIQNFVQNAIKFSPKGSVIHIKSNVKDDEFIVEVIDEGCGIDENVDLFAPFKRYGDKQGAGLGLFLAKGAAAAMNADINLKNRNDNKTGTVATLILPIVKKIKKYGQYNKI